MAEEREYSSWQRAWVGLLVAATLALTLWPLSWPKGRDSFPLSSFPMFSRELRNPLYAVAHAVVIDDAGGRHFVPPSYVANFEVLAARAAVSRAVRDKGQVAAELCAKIAGAVAQERDEFPGAVEVRLVRATYDAVAFMGEGERAPHHEEIGGSCPVQGAE